MMRPAFLTASAVLAASWLGATVAGEPTQNSRQVVILKLDDVTASGGRGGSPVSPRWQRTADFIEKSGLKASFGIIGYSLERDNQACFDWIKDLHRKGTVEFWNHGYRQRKAEDKAGEFEGPLEEQKTALEKTQRLAREKLGIELRVFGPHWSGTNRDTAKALEGFPEIKMCFYDPKGARQFVFEYVLVLENPTFVPDFEKFKELYEKKAKAKECLALQGHPDMWDEKRWQGFVKIIEYLKAKGCVFMTPSEYLAEADKERAAGKGKVPTEEGPEQDVYVPKDLDDCFAELKKLLSKEVVEKMKNGPEQDMVQYHFGLGMWLRNNWGLWKGSRLSKWFNDKGIRHPDDMSGIILDSFWRHLNGKPIGLDAQIKPYQDYWKRAREREEKEKK